jgi:enoyl reductase-like protein
MDLEGSGLGLTEVLFHYLSGETEENQEYPSVRIDGVEV